MTANRAARAILRPLTSVLLSFPVALFSMTVVTDIAYLQTAEVQWTNFSAWLILGAMLFGGMVLVIALAALGQGWRGAARKRRAIYAGLVALMFLVGLINAFKHSQDGCSSVGALGLSLSIISALLGLAAGLVFWSSQVRDPVQ